MVKMYRLLLSFTRIKVRVNVEEASRVVVQRLDPVRVRPGMTGTFRLSHIYIVVACYRKRKKEKTNNVQFIN